jgi:hypothetical protein
LCAHPIWIVADRGEQQALNERRCDRLNAHVLPFTGRTPSWAPGLGASKLSRGRNQLA